MDRGSRDALETRTFTEAVRWLDRMPRDVDDLTRLYEWARMPDHARAIRGAYTLWHEVERLSAEDRQRICALSAESAASSGRADDHVVWLLPPENSVGEERARPSVRSVLAYVGVLLLAFTSMVSLLTHYAPASVRYEADASHARVLQLADGSRAHLAGGTAVRIRMLGDRREIRLTRGSAFFDVAKDVNRPFVVSSGRVTATALGTQFQVRRAEKVVRVAVREGRVAVRMTEGETTRELGVLTNSEALRIAASQIPATATPIDSAPELNWIHPVPLNGMTLREAIALFNRANVTQILVEDPRLLDIRLGGQVVVFDPETFARGLVRTGLVDTAVVSGRNGEAIRLGRRTP